jgi:predicted RNase H-like nuclease (RuvC/YqgF family)
MSKHRKPSLEMEFKLEREIKDLKQQLEKLKKQLKQVEKPAKIEGKPAAPVKKIGVKYCPTCESAIKETSIAGVGTMELCSAACGYRNMRRVK